MVKAAVIALIIAGLVAGYWLFQAAYPSATLRYRLTLVVQTPDGPKSGSSVVEVTYAKAVRCLGSSGEINISVRGEATAVDLGKYGQIFALLRAGKNPNSAAEWIVPKMFMEGELSSPPDASILRVRSLAGMRALTPDDLPMLVRFGNINDPKTVERIGPEDLSVSVAPGVRLSLATIEITQDSVTKNIDERLPWLDRINGGYLDGKFTGGGPALSSLLMGLDFKRGL